jgi:hypothetical protein
MIATRIMCLIFTFIVWKQYETFYPRKTCRMWLLHCLPSLRWRLCWSLATHHNHVALFHHYISLSEKKKKKFTNEFFAILFLGFYEIYVGLAQFYSLQCTSVSVQYHWAEWLIDKVAVDLTLGVGPAPAWGPRQAHRQVGWGYSPAPPSTKPSTTAKLLLRSQNNSRDDQLPT